MASIFLSHNSHDKPFVRRLAMALQAKGVRVWVDEAEIKVGDSLLDKIQSAIDETDYLAVVLSPNSVKSSWVNQELKQALNHELKSKAVKVLPILLADCEVPGFLRDKKYADFRSESDFSASVSELLKRLLPEAAAGDNVVHGLLPIFTITYNGQLSGDERELKVTVEEVLANIEARIDPPFDVNLNRDVIGNTSRDIPLTLRLAPTGSLALLARMHHLQQGAQLSVAEREERLDIKKLLGKVQEEIQLFRSSVYVLLTEPLLKNTGYVSDAIDIVNAIRGISGRIFGRYERGEGQTKIDLYRIREPRLYTSIFVDDKVLDSSGAGRRLSELMGLEFGSYATDLDLQTIREKVIPSIIVEVYKTSNKVEYQPSGSYTQLSDWFMGLA
jgi:TIR domain